MDLSYGLIVLFASAFFSSGAIAQANQLEEKISLKRNISFIEENQHNITPETPLPVYGTDTYLCFEISDPADFGNTAKEQLKKTKEILENNFINKKIQNKEELETFIAQIEGDVLGDNDEEYHLDKRWFPKWDFALEQPNSNYDQLSMCSLVSVNTNSVKSLKIKALGDFKSSHIYWITSNFFEQIEKSVK